MASSFANTSANEITKMIKNDPFIYNLFNNDSTQDFKINRNVNWIKIPTSFASENGKTSSISLMSVKVYTGDECNQIKNSINDPSDIVFSNEGHVALNFSENKTTAGFFYPNPTITENTGGEFGAQPVGIGDTVAAQTTNYSTSFFYNDKILFSKNLKWILYQLPGWYYSQGSAGTWKSTVNRTGKTVVPVYVLLYNTIHRQNFQDVYAKIINLNGNPFSNQSFVGPNTSYNMMIKKYCNAFRIQSLVSPNTGKELYHYADPSCELAIDTEVAKLSQTLSLNLTAETWQDSFYLGGKGGYVAAIQDLSAVPESDAYCSRGSGGGPSRFLREEAGVMKANSKTDSFMQILANYEIAHAIDALSLPANYNSDAPGDTTEGLTCPAKSLKFVDCAVSFNNIGELETNKDNIRPSCGNKKASTVKVTGKKPYSSNGNSTPSNGNSTPVNGNSTTVNGNSTPVNGNSTPVNGNSYTTTAHKKGLGSYLYIIIALIIIAVVFGLYFIF